MSKVYEALQRVQAEPKLMVEVRQNSHPKRSQENGPTDSANLGSNMTREMYQLSQRIGTLLPRSQSKIIQFIGSRKREGTSTIVREFARMLVENQKRSVLLLDEDCSDMAQYKAYGLQPKGTIQDIMVEGGTLDDIFTPVPHTLLCLGLLANGSPSPAGIDLACKGKEFWDPIRKMFDYILIDSHPISYSDKALSLCPIVDGVILVVESEYTRLHVVSNLKTRVSQSGGNILGFIFNKQRHYIPDWIYKWI